MPPAYWSPAPDQKRRAAGVGSSFSAPQPVRRPLGQRRVADHLIQVRGPVVGDLAVRAAVDDIVNLPQPGVAPFVAGTADRARLVAVEPVAPVSVTAVLKSLVPAAVRRGVRSAVADQSTRVVVVATAVGTLAALLCPGRTSQQYPPQHSEPQGHGCHADDGQEPSPARHRRSVWELHGVSKLQGARLPVGTGLVNPWDIS